LPLPLPPGQNPKCCGNADRLSAPLPFGEIQRSGNLTIHLHGLGDALARLATTDAAEGQGTTAGRETTPTISQPVFGLPPFTLMPVVLSVLSVLSVNDITLA